MWGPSPFFFSNRLTFQSATLGFTCAPLHTRAMAICILQIRSRKQAVVQRLEFEVFWPFYFPLFSVYGHDIGSFLSFLTFFSTSCRPRLHTELVLASRSGGQRSGETHARWYVDSFSPQGRVVTALHAMQMQWWDFHLLLLCIWR